MSKTVRRIIYRFFRAYWVDRLITQHRFECIASTPEALRVIRARRAALSASSGSGK